MRAAALEDDYDDAWRSDALDAIIQLSLTRTSFSSDDLRAALRTPPRSSQYGAAFRNAQSGRAHREHRLRNLHHEDKKSWSPPSVEAQARGNRQMIALVLAAAVFAAVWIPRAIRHDMRMAELYSLDDEELAAVLEVDPHYIERAKQW